MVQAAQWLVENEGPFIANLVKENPDFRLVMVGHSLGAGKQVVSRRNAWAF